MSGLPGATSEPTHSVCALSGGGRGTIDGRFISPEGETCSDAAFLLVCPSGGNLFVRPPLRTGCARLSRAAPTLRVIRAGAALRHITSVSRVCARILSRSSLFTAGTLATSAYHSNLDKEKRLRR
ncbi:hypothetical protein NDU88_009557 [Pleurodeles waltl]|uniref:Uncharacterized protein n=1 Tax=Pleurodeles waltl TaxID=8319 RepID=A0AAV7PZB7_PLEWA|nr:hypothetical protein NDU88_009557 [Pleurodeles waltl]